MALGGARVWAGDFDGARPFLEQAERMAPDEGHLYVCAVAPIFSAIAHIERNDMPAAHAEAARAIDLAMPSTGSATSPRRHSLTASSPAPPTSPIRQSPRLTWAWSVVNRSPEPILRAYVLASAGDVLSHHGHAEGAALIAEARRIVDRCPDPGIAGRYLARVEARHHVSTHPTRGHGARRGPDRARTRRPALSPLRSCHNARSPTSSTSRSTP